MSYRNRWLDWNPSDQIFWICASSKPSKPSKPGIEGFEGSTLTHSQKIGADPLPPHLADWPLSILELLQERIAIMEFDGGLPHAEALEKAEEDIRQVWLRGEAE